MPNKRVKDLDNVTFLKFIEEFTREAKAGNIEFPELAALRAERDALREAIKAAQIQLQATQINWQEECLFECNDIMTAALKGDA